MNVVRRLARWTLVVLLGAAGGGLGTVAVAGAAPPADGCVNSYLSRGRSVVAGPEYEIPYQSIGGAPYVENEVNSQPSTVSFASDAYEGFIGDIVLGTSGVYPRNPTSAVAHWPPVPDAKNGGASGTKASTTFGPLARTTAEAGPREAKSLAQALGDATAATAPSTAMSHTLFDGKVIKGTDEVVSYDVHVGPAVIKQMNSLIDYETDGTRAGTRATWKVQFSGIGNDSSEVYTLTPEGFAVQGGHAMPGATGVQQFNAGARQVADALEKAGVTRAELKVAPGTIELGDGELTVRVAALELRNAPVPSRNTTGHAQGVVFGFQNRYVKVVLGPCDADVNKVQPDTYQEPPDNSKQIGPIRFPDPTPPQYGGPKSTPPGRVPAPPAARPAPLTEAPVPASAAAPVGHARPDGFARPLATVQ